MSKVGDVGANNPNFIKTLGKLKQKRKNKISEEDPATAAFIARVQAATGVHLPGRVTTNPDESERLRKLFLIFDAWERPYYISLSITTAAVLYTVFLGVGRAFFKGFEDFRWALYLWIPLDALVDLIFIADSFVQSRTGFLKNGILVCERWPLLKRYLKQPQILLDIASILPFDIFYYSGQVKTLGMARLNRLCRIPRMFEFLDRTWRISSRPNLTRGATLVLYILIIVHWNACAYYQVSEFVGFGTDRWVLNNTKHPTATGQYLACIYWVAMTFTTGESFSTSPHNYTEAIFVVLNILVSISVFATLVGNISALVAEYSAKRFSFQDWFNDMRNYMRKRNISRELQDRVSSWFQHYWLDNGASAGKEEDLDMLPEHLKAEINMNAHLETLQRVKIFQDCEPGLLLALVNKLRLALFNPRETICLMGDVGKEMYIVKSGKLQVLGATGQLLVTLRAGASFGELALLNIVGTKTGNRRTATVISEGYSYLFVLTKEDLWIVLEDFPEAKKVFMKKGREILIKDGFIDPSKEGSESESTEQRVDRLLKEYDTMIQKMSVTLVGILRHELRVKKRVEELELEIEEMEQGVARNLCTAAHNYGTDAPF